MTAEHTPKRWWRSTKVANRSELGERYNPRRGGWREARARLNRRSAMARSYCVIATAGRHSLGCRACLGRRRMSVEEQLWRTADEARWFIIPEDAVLQGSPASFAGGRRSRVRSRSRGPLRSVRGGRPRLGAGGVRVRAGGASPPDRSQAGQGAGVSRCRATRARRPGQPAHAGRRPRSFALLGKLPRTIADGLSGEPARVIEANGTLAELHRRLNAAGIDIDDRLADFPIVSPACAGTSSSAASRRRPAQPSIRIRCSSGHISSRISRISWPRVETPSLPRIEWTWRLTVDLLRVSSRAISLLENARATSWATSFAPGEGRCVLRKGYRAAAEQRPHDRRGDSRRAIEPASDGVGRSRTTGRARLRAADSR